MPRPLVLIVDDDKEVRALERLALKSLFRVEEAQDGLTAWQIIRERLPMVVVTDMGMPGINGLELTRMIKETAETAGTAVILVSGATRGEDLPEGFWRIGTQADEFIQKPFGASRLVAAVQAQVERIVGFTPLPPGKGSYD